MKVFLVVLCLVGLSYGRVAPTISRELMDGFSFDFDGDMDMERPVEEDLHFDKVIEVDNPPRSDERDEWTLMPDDEGNLHLVNIEEMMNTPEPAFSVEEGVIFELFTPLNPTQHQIIRPGDKEALAASNFNPAWPTRFLVHGWNSKGDLTGPYAAAYNQAGNFNFIAVNWQAGAVTLYYPSARRRVNLVGPFLAQMVDFLVEEGGMNLDDCFLIGHSLGGHTVGIAGKHTKTGKVKKVVALDPALPLFSYNRPDERVDVEDGQHTECILTNAGLLGFSRPICAANYYPNGGSSQPGCGIDLTGACAHSRAHQFYLESINSPIGFWSWHCHSHERLSRGRCEIVGPNQVMGGDPTTEGIYHEEQFPGGVFYLHTERRSPFAMGYSDF